MLDGVLAEREYEEWETSRFELEEHDMSSEDDDEDKEEEEEEEENNEDDDSEGQQEGDRYGHAVKGLLWMEEFGWMEQRRESSEWG